MITFDNVSKSYGRQDIVRGASFHVSRGERVGLVGPNGTGKSTLFRLIMDEESTDDGAVHKSKSLAIGYLPQEIGDIGAEPLLKLVMETVADVKAIEAELASLEDALALNPRGEELEQLTDRQSVLLERYDHLDGYTLQSRAEKILLGLGFKRADFDRPAEVLSGGMRMRALLARILLSDPDLILLDEPTNHLDLASLLWLEEYLLGLRSSLILISHDRTFLNKTVTRILELEHGRLNLYAGNYRAYEEEKERRFLHVVSAYEKQQEKIRQIKDFVARNRTRKDKAKQAQARLKELDKMELIQLPEKKKELHFSFPSPSRPPATLIELKDILLTYGRPDPVFQDFGIRVGRDERIAFVGPNGAGKSSLLKMLAGAVIPDSGERNVPSGVVLAYFAQHQAEQLNPNQTVIGELMSVSGDATQTALRTLLGAFLFHGDDVFKKVSVLSGGERARLVMAKLLFSGANLLLLDEPTNHLDIDAREALEQALKAWPGAICLITHDRSLINVIATQIWDVEPGGRVTAYPGNLDDYLTTWKSLREEKATAPKTAPKAESRPKPRNKRNKARRRAEAELRRAIGQETKALKAKVTKLEEAIAAKSEELEKLNYDLADPEVYENPEKAAEISKKVAGLRAEIDDLGDDWAESAMELEEAQEEAEEKLKAARG